MVKVNIVTYSRYKKLWKKLEIDIKKLEKMEEIEVTPSFFNQIQKMEELKDESS